MSTKISFNLNNYQLTTLRAKNKLYSTLNSVFTKAYFKISNNAFEFCLRGGNGLIKTTLPIEYTGDSIYFSVDYSKWVVALQKFENSEQILFTLGGNLLTLKEGNNADVINLGIIKYDKDSSEADILDNLLPSASSTVKARDNEMILTDELLDAFSLADSLFISQDKCNSIGLSKEDVMYSSRALVLKIRLQDKLEDNLFKDLPSDENHIFIHSFVLKLLPLLSKFNSIIYFSDDYGVIYWSDTDTELIFTSEARRVALPDEEQWQSIKPENSESYFEVDLNSLCEGLSFFNGFYTGAVWKPITFEVEANKEVILTYKHPTTEITKTLNNVSSPYSGRFMLNSEILEKLANKIRNHYKEGNVEMLFNYDNDALGVYCSVGDGDYEMVLSKLTDDEE